jgi:nicotinamidase-related amidase
MPRALVVVDYQNDFVDGSLGSQAARDMEDRIASKIEEYLERGDRVVFTLDTHGEGYLQTDEGRRIPVEHCIRGTRGWEVHGKAAGYTGSARTVEKGAFGSLDLIGEVEGCDEIELCGVATNVCVMANAAILKAAYPESRVSVDSRCVASYDADLHGKALDVMRSMSIDVY